MRNTTLALLLTSTILGSGPAPAQAQPSVEIFLNETGAPVASAECIPVRLRCAQNGVSEKVLDTVRLGEPIRLELPPEAGDGDCFLEATTTDLWLPRILLRSGAYVVIPVLPAGSVRWRAATEPLPDTHRLLAETFDVSWHPGSDSASAAGISNCQRGEGEDKTARSCVVPSGTWNLHFHASGFADVRRLAVEVEPGQTVDLGKLVFSAGGVIEGVVLGTDGRIEGQAELTVSPWELDDLAQERGPPNKAPARPLTDGRGAFQIVGLSSGVYRLGIEGEAKSRLELGPLVVRERETLRLGTLELVAPPRLLLRVEPFLDPLDRPWHIELLADADSPTQLKTNELGEAVIEGVQAGEYPLWVVASSGERVHFERIEILGGEQIVEVDLPIVWIEGRLRLGDEPVSGHLFFGGRRGVTSLAWDTDQDGEFAGWLPRPGEWVVEVEVEDPPIHRKLKSVLVEANEAGDAWVELDLEDGFLTAAVLDGEGRRVPGARVLFVPADGREGPVDRPTDSSGEVEVRGLGPGPYWVQARSYEAGSMIESERQLVEVLESVRQPPVELTLLARREVQITVRSTSGRPAAGARVQVDPTRTPEMGMLLEQCSTDAGGLCFLRLPDSAAQAFLTILAVGHRMERGLYPLYPLNRDGGAVAITLEELKGGTLEIQGLPPGANLWEYALEDPAGRSWNGSELLEWARIHGQSLRATRLSVPGMEPGTYRLCRPAGAQEGSGLPACATAVLAAGGQASLVFEAPVFEDPIER